MSFNAESAVGYERRQHPRRTMAVGYTPIRVRRSGRKRFSLRGHVYDFSAGGVRFELDQALDAGERIDVEIKLPERIVYATGSVIRLYDEAGLTPVRMAMAFNESQDPRNPQRFRRFIDLLGAQRNSAAEAA